MDRRHFLEQAAGGLLVIGGGLLLPRRAWAGSLPQEPAGGALESATLHALPGKKALIKRTYRPPNYETPLAYLQGDFTPNEAFFVRYHLGSMPELGPESGKRAAGWKLAVGGDAVQRPLQLTLDELRRGFAEVELAAVCQCAGNRRGLFTPRVPGVQWGHGAMGNARWKGVRLKDVLDRAGVQKAALEVTFDGGDAPVVDRTPDFVKSLPLWKALDENTLIAWEMNGKPLPPLHGFPARLVVPGWAATYWVKHLSAINVVSQPFQGYWMKTAYRIPRGKFPVPDRFPSQATQTTTPITELLVNSLITSLEGGSEVPARRPLEVRGVAWDGGSGIQKVELSDDDGQSWRPARLGADHGKFSWRRWTLRCTPREAGPYTILARAVSRSGHTQGRELVENPAGFHHNVIQQVTLSVSPHK